MKTTAAPMRFPKFLPAIILVLLVAITVNAQHKVSSSHVESVSVLSQNRIFVINSVPYDDFSPSLRGKTVVFRLHRSYGKSLDFNGITGIPLYAMSRGFKPTGNTLFLSNDGRVIFDVIPNGAVESTEGLQSINVYRDGKHLKGYTLAEVTGCNVSKERCSLVYLNSHEGAGRNKSRIAEKQVLTTSMTEEEQFLSKKAIFSHENTVYITDSKKVVHRFSLEDGSYLGSSPFLQIYKDIKSLGDSSPSN